MFHTENGRMRARVQTRAGIIVNYWYQVYTSEWWTFALYRSRIKPKRRNKEDFERGGLGGVATTSSREGERESKGAIALPRARESSESALLLNQRSFFITLAISALLVSSIQFNALIRALILIESSFFHQSIRAFLFIRSVSHVSFFLFLFSLKNRA